MRRMTEQLSGLKKFKASPSNRMDEKPLPKLQE